MGGNNKASRLEGWTDPADLSSLYFPSTAAKENEDTTTTTPPYYIGPVEIRTKDKASSERGLFASSDIAMGDPLLLLPATAHADVDAVYEEWKKQQSSVDVNVAAERVLVQAILQAQKTNPQLLQSLACLEGSGLDYSNVDEDDLLPILLGEEDSASKQSKKSLLMEPLTEHQIQQVIRRNAFGPEFTTSFKRVQQRWEAAADVEKSYRPPRFLGLYPLAAMINHSCVPNAIRVFVPSTTQKNGTSMVVVHACQPIPAGTEVVWSYVPLTDNPTRYTLLSALDFVCTCPRCAAEASIPHLSAVTVDVLEDTILPQLPSNEWRRYVRVGYLKVYLHEMNHDTSSKRDWLPICTQLHLALASCNNASTEHLSILHWCYELAAPQQRTFWVQQLRTAIMTRYGRCGDSVEQIRSLLQHTRTVVRMPNGMDIVDHKFI